MKIRIMAVMIGILIGLLAIQMMTKPPQIVFKYPTLDNIYTTTYIDDDDVCYKYYAMEVPCQKSHPDLTGYDNSD